MRRNRDDRRGQAVAGVRALLADDDVTHRDSGQDWQKQTSASAYLHSLAANLVGPVDALLNDGTDGGGGTAEASGSSTAGGDESSGAGASLLPMAAAEDPADRPVPTDAFKALFGLSSIVGASTPLLFPCSPRSV